jgi:SagB-type dehydrogenase family enzyme
VKVRRALDLQLRVVGDDLVLHSPQQVRSYRRGALQDARLLDLLLRLAEWCDMEEAAKQLTELAAIPFAAARAEILRLKDAGILVSDEDPRMDSVFQGAQRWAENGWREPFTYHLLSDAMERVDYSGPEGQRLDIETMRKYLAEDPQPPMYMPSVSESTVTLPEPNKTFHMTVTEAMAAGSRRHQASLPLTAEQLSTILWFGFGQVGVKRQPVSGDRIRKASPSGGSRHPTEAYVIVLEGEEIPVGAYHYGVRDHVLEQIISDGDPQWLARHVVGKHEWMEFRPAVALVLTSRVELSMYRYRENYSYRPIHHDVGHVLETATLTAIAMGCEAFRGYSADEAQVAAKLGNQRLSNPVMAFMLLARVGDGDVVHAQ